MELVHQSMLWYGPSRGDLQVTRSDSIAMSGQDWRNVRDGVVDTFITGEASFLSSEGDD